MALGSIYSHSILKQINKNNWRDSFFSPSPLHPKKTKYQKNIKSSDSSSTQNLNHLIKFFASLYISYIMADAEKLSAQINANTTTNDDDDDIINEMVTPARPSVASSAVSHNAEEKQDVVPLPTSINKAEPDDNAIPEDLIPEADFAENMTKPDTNNNDNDNDNNITDNIDDNETEALPEDTGDIGDTGDNNRENNQIVAADTGVAAAFSGNTSNDALIANLVSSDNTNNDVAVTTANSDDDNQNVRLEMGSVFDDTNKDNVPKDNAVDTELANNNAASDIDINRADRGSIYNVEAVPMDESGQDTHGSIPNLIVELRFDLKLCFQGIEVDDNIVGPLIGLRPIVESRLGQDLMDLVSGVVNEDQRVLLLLTEYNTADQKFYNAAKWGSVGMLFLFLFLF